MQSAKKKVLSESFLNFLNSDGSDLNTIGKNLAQAESVTGRLLPHHNKMIQNQTCDDGSSTQRKKQSQYLYCSVGAPVSTPA